MELRSYVHCLDGQEKTVTSFNIHYNEESFRSYHDTVRHTTLQAELRHPPLRTLDDSVGVAVIIMIECSVGVNG